MFLYQTLIGVPTAEKYEFVNWDDIPNNMEKTKIHVPVTTPNTAYGKVQHVPNHQPEQ